MVQVFKLLEPHIDLFNKLSIQMIVYKSVLIRIVYVKFQVSGLIQSIFEIFY